MQVVEGSWGIGGSLDDCPPFLTHLTPYLQFAADFARLSQHWLIREAYGETGALLAFLALHHAYHGMGALSNQISKRYGLDWNVSGMGMGAGWRFGRALRIYAMHGKIVDLLC